MRGLGAHNAPSMIILHFQRFGKGFGKNSGESEAVFYKIGRKMQESLLAGDSTEIVRRLSEMLLTFFQNSL